MAIDARTVSRVAQTRARQMDDLDEPATQAEEHAAVGVALTLARDVTAEAYRLIQELDRRGVPVSRTKTRVGNAYNAMDEACAVYNYDVIQGMASQTKSQRGRAADYDLV